MAACMDVSIISIIQTKEQNEQGEKPGKQTGIACPKCYNILWEYGYGELFHFCCELGHIYSPKSLLAEQMIALKMAFRYELRSLKEKQASFTE
jgi:two-component system, chemotaxis family, protein-glutamate methylesterase/glutaminase